MNTAPQMDATFLNQRRDAIRRHPTQGGIDYVDVKKSASDEWELWLYFVPAAEGITDKNVTPESMTTDNIRITDAMGIADPSIQIVEPIDLNPQDDEDNTVDNAVRIQVREEEQTALSSGDSPTYTLQLVDLPNLDPFFAQVSFSLQVDEPSRVDCRLSLEAEPEAAPVPEINYLAKDYSTFHKLMLDRLSVVMPEWQERNPADMGMALVEVLAHAADYLSYYQDAVATEAYLGTARQRISVRRHARLLDYLMHEGCNTRAWVEIQVSADVSLSEGTQLMTRISGQDPRISPQVGRTPDAFGATYNQVSGETPQVFETMHAATLAPAHNEIHFYTWGASQFTLPEGATRTALRKNGVDSEIGVQPGDVLIFEEVISPETGVAAGANPAHRHAVRLTDATSAVDAIGGALHRETSESIPIVEIAWDAADALSFDMCVSTIVDGANVENVSVARGNIVLADHGQTITDESLSPATVSENGGYRPRLNRANLTHRVSYDDELAQAQSAAAAMTQSLDEALPVITLAEADEIWTPQKDLLNSDRFAREFVVEIDSDGVAYLRFGDGEHGKQPAAGTELRATYRIGNGTAGNVGSEAIAHLVTDEIGIIKVRNPIPAPGGVEPESIARVRSDAPQALRNQERAVTEADYASIASRHPEVRRVAATLQWTGSWYTVFVTVDRVDNQPVDDAFKAELREFLDRFRLAGYDLEIRPPALVSLDIALTVHVGPDHFRSTVRGALDETFSDVDLPDGRRGFFHPDNFNFGQSVYLSQLVATAMEAPGVAWIETTRFQRRRQPARGELDSGEIPIASLEIARLHNDPDAPENGIIMFNLEGGQ
ncbi:MAG: putative baseplate assembly protein [Candidatus Poribacteria bacterium]|nr:putative baseplate assembly protein [Candidatus Poribacteria bacterium]